MNHLYCYKMTWDTGFAPNPHGGVLTLATCKPIIRRCAMVGDWISGWAARKVHDNNGDAHPFTDGQNLIYLARITKKLTFDEYWCKYKQKKPKKLHTNGFIATKGCGSGCLGKDINYDEGDNIYEPLKNGEYRQHDNKYHQEKDKAHDLSGKYVLICDEFYYFGVKKALRIEEEIFPYIVPRCKKITLDDGSCLIKYINKKYSQGIITNKQ